MEGGVIHDMPASFDEEKLTILSTRLFEAITSSIQGALLHCETRWPEPHFRKYTIERYDNRFSFSLFFSILTSICILHLLFSFLCSTGMELEKYTIHVIFQGSACVCIL